MIAHLVPGPPESSTPKHKAWGKESETLSGDTLSDAVWGDEIPGEEDSRAQID